MRNKCSIIWIYDQMAAWHKYSRAAASQKALKGEKLLKECTAIISSTAALMWGRLINSLSHLITGDVA